MNAKERLDILIKKSRVDLYKPIAVAEILYRHRLEQLDLADKSQYRRRSYEWMREVVARLHQKTTTLNSRYWDQLFDPEVLPPEMLQGLGQVNVASHGIVEVYIYVHLREKFAALHKIRQSLENADGRFDLASFLDQFESDARFARSVDKIYEIVVYALFNAVVDALDAKVTLSVADSRSSILADFEDFAQLVLGVDSRNTSITQSARLYRVGTANANDAGLDMWANFGPAVQVKHLTLSQEQVSGICHGLRADQVIIVCKESEAKVIETVVRQIGDVQTLRGIITEKDLIRWYDLCFSKPYRASLGKRLLAAMVAEFRAEFPLSDSDRIDAFFAERGYDAKVLNESQFGMTGIVAQE
ncbi:MAG: HaeII family restriction endonuclease [Thermoguttaceae bacterium]